MLAMKMRHFAELAPKLGYAGVITKAENDDVG